MTRPLLSVSDLSAEEIRGLFHRAEEAAGDPMELRRVLNGKLVAGLFWQPAAREEAALRAACARAGASYASGPDLLPGFPDADLLEGAEAAGSVADVLVVRHPFEGAARAAGAAAGVPVLNAGDGAREDVVRGLLALRDVFARRGDRGPRSVALCGDLRHNRLAHSLASGLSALGTTVLLVPARGAEMPEHLLARTAGRRGHQPLRFEAQSLRTILDMVDTIVLSPEVPYQHPLFADLSVPGEEERRRARAAVESLDAIFVAAPRAEDGGPPAAAPPGASGEGHPWLREEGRVVFGPFRRGGGPPPPVPGALRAEAAREVPLLAEILVTMLGPSPRVPGSPPGGRAEPEGTGSPEGVRCAGPRCVVRRERRVLPSFEVARRDPLVLDCRFCGVPVRPRYAGSRVERRYHPVRSAEVRKVLPPNLVYFGTRREAEDAGFRPAQRLPAPKGLEDLG